MREERQAGRQADMQADRQDRQERQADRRGRQAGRQERQAAVPSWTGRPIQTPLAAAAGPLPATATATTTAQPSPALESVIRHQEALSSPSPSPSHIKWPFNSTLAVIALPARSYAIFCLEPSYPRARLQNETGNHHQPPPEQNANLLMVFSLAYRGNDIHVFFF